MPREIPDSVDLAILGGGINGAGMAVVAATAGYRTVLLEKADFASGTSSKSSKLIHGGLRYLEQGQFALVRESQAERDALLQNKPHLVTPLGFLLPSYDGDRRSAWMLRAGMCLYDLLATTNSLPRPEWLTRSRTTELAPALRQPSLRGAGLYYDAQVDDARLVLEEIQTATDAGSSCLNYCTVTAIAQREGEVRLDYRDDSSSRTGSLRARCLYVAAGPWTDKIRHQLLGLERNVLRPTRGTHIMLRNCLAPYAVLGTSPSDGRVFFVIPWRGMSLVGTTDSDYDRDPDLVEVESSEIRYLLEGVRHYFPQSRIDDTHVVSTFVGLRPLLAAGTGDASSASREAMVLRDGRVLFIAGGKLTTYRAMAREAWREVISILGEPPRTTLHLPAWSNRNRRCGRETLSSAEGQTETIRLPPIMTTALRMKYGARIAQLMELLRLDPSLIQPLDDRHTELRVQVAHAVVHEYALTVEDVLMRRLGMGHSDSLTDAGILATAEVMARYAGWSEGQREREVERFKSCPAWCNAIHTS